MRVAFHRCHHLVLLRLPMAAQDPSRLGSGWATDGSREKGSIDCSRQVIPSGGHAGQALHAHLPFPDGERGNARAQCLRDDPRDRLSFPSKDGLLNHGRGAVSLLQRLILPGTPLICFVLLRRPDGCFSRVISATAVASKRLRLHPHFIIHDTHIHIQRTHTGMLWPTNPVGRTSPPATTHCGVPLAWAHLPTRALVPSTTRSR